MTATTFLHDGELNIPTSNKVINDLLKEVREATGQDWQILELKLYPKKKWFQRPSDRAPKLFYEVYLYVGGMGPWQQINFYREGTDWSINLVNTSELVVAYLYGILAGIHQAGLKNDKPAV